MNIKHLTNKTIEVISHRVNFENNYITVHEFNGHLLTYDQPVIFSGFDGIRECYGGEIQSIDSCTNYLFIGEAIDIVNNSKYSNQWYKSLVFKEVMTAYYHA